MTVISSVTDPERLSLTVVAEFAAGPDRVWGVWEDPRQLERWWGPPTYPATFTRHDFAVGGESRYHMTGPQGDTPRGLLAHVHDRRAAFPRIRERSRGRGRRTDGRPRAHGCASSPSKRTATAPG